MARIGHHTAASLGMPETAWSKMVRCDIDKITAQERPERKLTAAEFKRKHLNKAACGAVGKREAKRVALSELGALGKKDLRKMSDDWQKRQSSNVDGTFNRKHSKPGACIITKG